MRDYLVLCIHYIHYALVKELLIGMPGFRRERLGTTIAVRLTQSCGRMTEHCEKFVHDIIAFLREGKMSDGQGMVMLLRN